MNRKVSILIPTYEREAYIAECIQSALDQTYDDFEIVVVDNASSDRTWEICQEFAEQSPKVRAFRNETNIGPVRNWLRCVQEAKGAFSKILFSDDLLEPNCLEQMVLGLDQKDTGFVFCAAKIGSDIENSQVAYERDGDGLIEAHEYADMVLAGKAPVSPGAVMLRTSDLRENLRTEFPTAKPHDFLKNGAGPDVMIMLLTATQYKFVKHLGEALVFFRAHPGSFTIGDGTGSVRDNYEFMNSYYFHRHASWLRWMTYLSSRYSKRVATAGQFIAPQSFIRDREGKGAYHEVAMLFLLIPVGIIKNIRRQFKKVMARRALKKLN